MNENDMKQISPENIQNYDATTKYTGPLTKEELMEIFLENFQGMKHGGLD